MKFRVFVVLFVMMSGCLHRGADAVSTAMGALAVQAMESRDCVTPAPIQKSEPTPEVDAPKGGTTIKATVSETSVDNELRALMAEDPRMSAIIDMVMCNPDDRAMFRWQITQAERACRDAWNSNEDDRFGPEESLAMLGAKVAYEVFAADCGATPGESAYLIDFWAQVWRPGYTWSPEWDGCFGTHPDRVAQQGAVLEYYVDEEREGVAER